MRLDNEEKLISIEDLYEDDEFVLTKAIYQKGVFKSEELSIGIKDKSGDIVRFIDLLKRLL